MQNKSSKTIFTTVSIDKETGGLVEKISKTRSHTDGFQRNNAKCLDEKGISRFVPHSSI